MVAAEHLGTAAVASALSVEQVTLGPIALFPLLGAALAYLVGRQ